MNLAGDDQGKPQERLTLRFVMKALWAGVCRTNHWKRAESATKILVVLEINVEPRRSVETVALPFEPRCGMFGRVRSAAATIGGRLGRTGMGLKTGFAWLLAVRGRLEL